MRMAREGAISRQAVIETLTFLGCKESAINAISDMPPAAPQQRWIPVSKRLPETNDEMLVTYIVNGNHKKRYVETATYFDDGEEGKWISVNDEYKIPGTKVEIIAWMPLPGPYKAESEG